MEAKKSEKEAWTQNISYRAELEAYKKQVEILETTLTNLKSRFEEKVRRYNMLKLEMEDLEMRTAIAETSYINLLDALERMHQLVSKRYTESIPEMVRREMISNIDMLIEHIKSVIESVKGLTPQVPIVTTPPPTK